MSFSVRLAHWELSVCQGCLLASYVEQPEPELAHRVSSQPRVALVSLVSWVPPTATTYGDAAGEAGPHPWAPGGGGVNPPRGGERPAVCWPPRPGWAPGEAAAVGSACAPHRA